MVEHSNRNEGQWNLEEECVIRRHINEAVDHKRRGKYTLHKQRVEVCEM